MNPDSFAVVGVVTNNFYGGHIEMKDTTNTRDLLVTTPTRAQNK
jgi:hypothetical protein